MTEGIRERGDAAWLRQYNLAAVGRPHDRLLEFVPHGEVSVARLRVPELCHPNAPGVLKRELEAHFAEAKPRHLVLDLSEVHFVGSAVVGILVWADARMRFEGGRLALAGVHWRVHELLELCGLGRLLPCFPRAEEAVRSLGFP